MPSCTALAFFCLLLAGCMSPVARIDQRAAADGLVREVLPGTIFQHLSYTRPNASHGGRVLHVYIEHDGTPWQRGSQVAADPTPRQPLMLELMRLDDAAVLYLGRPCYFGLERDPPCNPLWWTHRRYSPQVVDSMAAALRHFLATRPYDRLAFFGHSGGGTLAVLLAERFPKTAAVVTLGANLDIDRWAALHDYSPLRGSLNPARRPPLPPTMLQWHYVGAADRNVPIELVETYVRGHAGAEAIVVPDIDHACCWQSVWARVLTRLRQHLASH